MKKSVYSLGSADPVTFHSFAGADIKVYCILNEAEARNAARQTDKPGKCWYDILAFSFETFNKLGTLTRIMPDGNQRPLSKDIYHLLFVATDEFGNQTRMALLGITDADIAFEISIDDTVMYSKTTFTFTSVVLWKKIVHEGQFMSSTVGTG